MAMLSTRGRSWPLVTGGEESRAAGPGWQEERPPTGTSEDSPLPHKSPGPQLSPYKEMLGLQGSESFRQLKPRQGRPQPTLALCQPGYTYSSGNDRIDKKSFLHLENFKR